jgi:predicted amidohydrolase YtcJ
MDLIEKPAPTEAETLEQFETTMLDALRVGLTSIHDAASLPNDIAFFKRHVFLAKIFSPSIRSHYVLGWLMRVVYPRVFYYMNGAYTEHTLR